MNVSESLSDQIRRKVKQMVDQQKPFQPEPYRFVPVLNPEVDKEAFSEFRKTYEKHLDSLNDTYLTNPRLASASNLDLLLSKLNHVINEPVQRKRIGFTGIVKALIHKIVRFGLESELQRIEAVNSICVQTINEINQGLREFADLQRNFNAMIALFGQAIVPVMDEKVKTPIESCKTLDAKFNSLLAENVTLLQQRMDVLFNGLDRRHNEIATWLSNTIAEFRHVCTDFEHVRVVFEQLSSETQSQFRELVKETRSALMVQERVSAQSIHTDPIPSNPTDSYKNSPKLLDYAYYAFEQVNRGSESYIKNSQRDYLNVIEERSPALDIGCGRGEFLELLRENRIDATGIDSNDMMIQHCKEKGLHAIHADAIDYLGTVGAGTLGSITAFQVIEHLSTTNLTKFLNSAYQALRNGGVIILETVNTSSIYAMMHYYYRDPTHCRPRHPEAYRFFLESHGFTNISLSYRSAPADIANESSLIPPIVEDPVLAAFLGELSRTLKTLKTFVYADCDISLVGYKPGETSCERE